MCYVPHINPFPQSNSPGAPPLRPPRPARLQRRSGFNLRKISRLLSSGIGGNLVFYFYQTVNNSWNMGTRKSRQYQEPSSTLQDSSSSARARKWGEYTCDLPPWTLDRMLGDIAERHPDISWVIVTGVAHIGHVQWWIDKTLYMHCSYSSLQMRYINLPLFTIITETGKFVQGTCRPTTFGCNHSTQISMWQRLFLKLKGICF